MKTPISLTQRTMHGFLWMFSQAIVTKIAGIATQIALAWLLLPEDYGLIGLAYSIRAFAALVETGGVRLLLVSRQDEYTRLANAGFWYAVSLGLATAGIMALVAPFVARYYQSPELVGLVLVMAVAVPFQSMWVVPSARLDIDLRFRAKAMINIFYWVGGMVLSVVFALWGFGAYSFALPLLITSPLSALFYLMLSRPPIQWRFQFFQWIAFLRVSSLIILTAIFNRIVAMGAPLILGAFYSPNIVGLFYFASALSLQVVSLISSNLAGILFPVLSKIQNDPERLKKAFIRAVRVLALLAIPFSLCIAAIADPLIRLLFADKWLPTIPILQILAIGMAFSASGSIVGSYLVAQKKFRLLLLASVFRCLVFFILTLSAVRFGLTSFVIAISTVNILSPALNIFLTFGFRRSAITILGKIVWLPLLGSALATILFQPLSQSLPNGSASLLAEIIVGLTLFALATLALTWKMDRELWTELLSLKNRLLERLLSSKAFSKSPERLKKRGIL